MHLNNGPPNWKLIQIYLQCVGPASQCAYLYWSHIYIYIYIYSVCMRCTQLRAAHFDCQKATWVTRQINRDTERGIDRHRYIHRHRQISSTGPHRGPPDHCLGDNKKLYNLYLRTVVSFIDLFIPPTGNFQKPFGTITSAIVYSTIPTYKL